MLLATEPFAGLAYQSATAYRLPESRIVVVQHPLGAVDETAVRDRAASAVERTVGLLTGAMAVTPPVEG